MLIVLHSVLMAFFTTFTSAAVKVESNGVGLRQRSLDGRVSKEHLLFQTDVSTKLACATACMKYATCVAFSTSPKGPSSKKLTCRGHDSKSISQSSTVAIPGSKTYVMKEKQSESSWLERPCTTDSDCPSTVANVVCFPSAGQCLCKPGYYYSHSLDECIADCPLEDQTTMFLKYPSSYIKGNNEQVTPLQSDEQCLQFCLSWSQCRSVETRPNKDLCQVASVTPLTTGTVFSNSESGNDFYQRTCL